MRAARIHAFGGPEVIRIEEAPTPNAGPGEVRVRIQGSSVNPVDYKIRQGGYLPESALPIALGRDVCGVVSQVGQGAEGVAVGDAVFAMLPREKGGNAEFVTLKPEVLARKPERLDPIQAGAVPLAAMTAWQGLFDQGGLASGQRVLIHGAAGGVGHFAVQFARARGAVVFATCSTPDVDFVRGLGAEEVIDYKRERFEDRAREIDLVYDLVAGETQERSWSVLREGGIIVSTLKEPDKQKAAEHKARGVHYMAQPNAAELEQIRALIDTGQVMPFVDRVFPLDELAQAQSFLEHEHVRGKVAMRVG